MCILACVIDNTKQYLIFHVNVNSDYLLHSFIHIIMIHYTYNILIGGAS